MFRSALVRLRVANDWPQARLAAQLGVSKRTLSHWECGHWLPGFKQRLHIVLSLRDCPPEDVLALADALGVSINPAVAPFLQPYRDALDDSPSVPDVVAAPAAVALPPRVPTDPARLRSAMDAVVRDAADAMNVSANELRAAVGQALAACEALGGTVEEMREAVGVRVNARAKTG